ncbi:hypothetical protein SKAU_G00128520 [Synaphobranchus kaupii]|uniref:Ig-like domain-containing protein n=1 Tax=Synaphobranchus kaupii TaxID=118154 RepID=A0A9Q1FQH5_SYNKA|nr:hypothetical protein SKAU_G00128520 [Synaphobranchus kaupii]
MPHSTPPPPPVALDRPQTTSPNGTESRPPSAVAWVLHMPPYRRTAVIPFAKTLPIFTKESVGHDVAPYFKTEPGPPQTHLEGNRLVLTCLAEGSWPLEFKWMLNNTDITSFSPQYKYTVASLQRSNAGFYQCVVRNRRGALMQRKAEVHVAYMGNFAEQEQRKTVSQGKAAILNSPAVSSFPRPQVTWFRDGYKIIPSYRVNVPSAPHAMRVLAASVRAMRSPVMRSPVPRPAHTGGCGSCSGAGHRSRRRGILSEKAQLMPVCATLSSQRPVSPLVFV